MDDYVVIFRGKYGANQRRQTLSGGVWPSRLMRLAFSPSHLWIATLCSLCIGVLDNLFQALSVKEKASTNPRWVSTACIGASGIKASALFESAPVGVWAGLLEQRLSWHWVIENSTKAWARERLEAFARVRDLGLALCLGSSQLPAALASADRSSWACGRRWV